MAQHTSRHRVYKIGNDPNLPELSRQAVSTGWSRHYVGNKGEDITTVLENRSREGKVPIGQTDLIRYKSLKAHKAALQVNPWSMWVKLYSRVYQRKFAEAMCDSKCKEEYLTWRGKIGSQIVRYVWPIPGQNGIPDIPGGPWDGENWNGNQDTEGMPVRDMIETICPLPPISFKEPVTEPHIMAERDLLYVREKRRRGQLPNRRVSNDDDDDLDEEIYNTFADPVIEQSAEVEETPAVAAALDEVEEGFGGDVSVDNVLNAISVEQRQREIERNVERSAPTPAIVEIPVPTTEQVLAPVPSQNDSLQIPSVIPSIEPPSKRARIENLTELPDLPVLTDMEEDEDEPLRQLFRQSNIVRQEESTPFSMDGITKEDIDMIFQDNMVPPESYPSMAKTLYDLIKDVDYDLSKLTYYYELIHLWKIRTMTKEGAGLFYNRDPRLPLPHLGQNVKGVLISLSKALGELDFEIKFKECILWKTEDEGYDKFWMKLYLLHCPYSESDFVNPHLPIISIRILENDKVLKSFWNKLQDSHLYQTDKIDYDEVPNTLDTSTEFRDIFTDRLCGQVLYQNLNVLLKRVQSNKKLPRSHQITIPNLHILGKTQADKENFESYFQIFVVPEIIDKFSPSVKRFLYGDDALDDMQISDAQLVKFTKVTKTEKKKRPELYIDGREYFTITVKITLSV